MTDLNWKEIPRWIVESSKLLRGKDDSFNYQHCCNSTWYHLGWEFDVGHSNHDLNCSAMISNNICFSDRKSHVLKTTDLHVILQECESQHNSNCNQNQVCHILPYSCHHNPFLNTNHTQRHNVLEQPPWKNVFNLQNKSIQKTGYNGASMVWKFSTAFCFYCDNSDWTSFKNSSRSQHSPFFWEAAYILLALIQFDWMPNFVIEPSLESKP